MALRGSSWVCVALLFMVACGRQSRRVIDDYVTPTGGAATNGNVAGGSPAGGSKGSGIADAQPLSDPGPCWTQAEAGQAPVADVTLPATAAKLLVAEGGEALVYVFGWGVPAAWRRHAGIWDEGPSSFPDVEWLPAAALGADGVAQMIRKIPSSTQLYVDELYAMSVSPDGTASDSVLIGDSGIGWWQEAYGATPVLRSNANGQALVAWARLDQEVPDWPMSLWVNQADLHQPWPPARPLDPIARVGTSTPAVVLWDDGREWVAWATYDLGVYQLWLASGDNGTWTAPTLVSGAEENLRYGAIGSSLGLVVADDGTIIVTYERETVDGNAFVARESTDGVHWGDPQELALGQNVIGINFTSSAGGGIFAEWDYWPPPGEPLDTAIYFPGRGWTEPVAFADGAQSGATVAIHSDGRAAIAYLGAKTDGSELCHPGVVVRRYAPDLGWSPAESVDTTGTEVEGLGYSGSDLIVAWVGQGQEVYAKVLR